MELLLVEQTGLVGLNDDTFRDEKGEAGVEQTDFVGLIDDAFRDEQGKADVRGVVSTSK